MTINRSNKKSEFFLLLKGNQKELTELHKTLINEIIVIGKRESMTLSEDEIDLVAFLKTYLNLVCFLLMDVVTSG